MLLKVYTTHLYLQINNNVIEGMIQPQLHKLNKEITEALNELEAEYYTSAFRGKLCDVKVNTPNNTNVD